MQSFITKLLIISVFYLITNSLTIYPQIKVPVANFLGISDILRTPHTCLDFHNNTLVAGDQLGAISIWEYQSHSVILLSLTRTNNTNATYDPVLALKLYNSGLRCAFATTSGVFTIYILKDKANPVEQFTQHLNIKDFVITSDSKTLISVNGDNLLQIWIINQNDLSLVYTNTSNVTSSYQKIAISPSSNLVATGNKDRLHLFRVDGQQLIWIQTTNQLKVNDEFFCVQFSSNLSHLFSSNGEYVYQWSYNNTDLSLKHFYKIGSISSTLDVSPSARYISVNNKNHLQFYDIVQYQIDNQRQTENYPAKQVKFIDDKHMITAGASIRTMQIDMLTTNTSNIITNATDHYINSVNHFDGVFSLSVHKNSRLAVSTSQNINNIKLWKLLSNNRLELLSSDTVIYIDIFRPSEMTLNCSAISPNGEHIVVAGSQPFDIVMYTPSNNKLAYPIRSDPNNTHFGYVIGLAFNTNSTHVVSASAVGQIYLFELFNKRELNFKGKNTGLRASGFSHMVISKDSQFVITSDRYSNQTKVALLAIWKLDYAKSKITLVNQTFFEQSHQSDVTQMTISPDQKFIASLGSNGQIRFWRLEHYTMIDLMQQIPVAVYGSILFTDDGKYIMASTSKQVHLYTYDDNGLILQSKYPKDFDISFPNVLSEIDGVFLEGNADQTIRMYDIRQQ